MHNGRRICLLVLGMHRSGTSALARVVSLLGADLPKTIMGPNRGNERGHWEPERLVACHDRLLERLGSRWNDWRSLDTVDLPAAVLTDFTRELSDLIDADYPESSLFVLKEPRLCRLVPFYARLLREKGIEARYLLAIRNPLAVIHSLSDRDGIWPGRVALLWLRHALDSEFATRDASRAIVSFEQVLHDWRPVMQRAGARISLRWPRPFDDAAADIAAFLTGEMQHFAPSRRELAARDDVPAWVRQTYRALLDLEINPDDDAAIATLDAIRDAFDAASPMFADALQREVDTGRAELAAARADVAAKATRIKQLDVNVAGLGSEIAKRDASIVALKAEIAARDEKLAFGEGTIKGLTAQVMAQREEIARLAAELTRMRDDLGGNAPNHAQTLKKVAADGT
jgi:hypothetical protein